MKENNNKYNKQKITSKSAMGLLVLFIQKILRMKQTVSASKYQSTITNKSNLVAHSILSEKEIISHYYKARSRHMKIDQLLAKHYAPNIKNMSS